MVWLIIAEFCAILAAYCGLAWFDKVLRDGWLAALLTLAAMGGAAMAAIRFLVDNQVSTGAKWGGASIGMVVFVVIVLLPEERRAAKAERAWQAEFGDDAMLDAGVEAAIETEVGPWLQEDDLAG